MTQTGAQSINLNATATKDDLRFGWTEWAGRKSAQITTFGFTLMLFVNRNWVESLQISWMAADA